MHPNMIPVPVSTLADVERLASVMRAVCESDPDTEPVQYSTTDEQAIERAKKASKSVMEDGHLRVIHHKGQLINVVLTKDQFAGRWNFSTSVITGSLPPGRVSDEVAEMLAVGFLGEGYQEIEPEGHWKTVRQFIKGYENKEGAPS